MQPEPPTSSVNTQPVILAVPASFVQSTGVHSPPFAQVFPTTHSAQETTSPMEHL